MNGHQMGWNCLSGTKAQRKAQVVMGMTVNAPMARGRAIRLSRCAASWRSPLRCQSIAVKKPLRRKNTGIRNPWIAKNISV